MCTCDVEPADFYSTTRPVSRAERECEECGATIHRGETYVRIAGMWDGDISTHVLCTTCDAWSEAFGVAMRRECGAACWTLGAMWQEIADFCEEHLYYNPATGEEYERPRRREPMFVVQAATVGR